MNIPSYFRLFANTFNVLEYLFILQHEEKKVNWFRFTSRKLGFRSPRFKLCVQTMRPEPSEEKFYCVFSGVSDS